MTQSWVDGACRQSERGARRLWRVCAASPRIFLLAAVTLVSVELALAQPAGTAACEVPRATADDDLAIVETARPTPDAGSTVIQVEGEDAVLGTPATLPIGSPVAATPVASVPDPLEALGGELTAVAEALAACLSAGDSETVVTLAAERYLGQLFGSSVPLSAEDYLAITADLTPVPTRIVSVEEVMQPAEDRGIAVITQVVGNQLMRAEWVFEPAPDGERPAGTVGWRVAGERQLPVLPPSGAAAIAVEIDDLSFTLAETTVTGPDVVLRGENDADEDHEMLVLRFAPGFTTADLLRAAGPDLPEQVTFIGEIPVRAGEENDLVLVDLEAGEYTIVCLFPDAQGTPHLAQGMEAVFTVE